MQRKFVYNLEFRPHVNQMQIGDYLFARVPEYENRVKNLQQLVDIHDGEFHLAPTTGTHQITATVQIPEKEKVAALDWGHNNPTQLNDILLSLTLFTGRNVFEIDNKDKDKPVITDQRTFNYGGSLECALNYESEFFDQDSGRVLDKSEANYMTYPMMVQRDVSLEKGVNAVLATISTSEWQAKYDKGYFLFLYRQALQRAIIETNFILCWTIWEHLFALHKRDELSETELMNSKLKKIEFIFETYFQEQLTDKSKLEIERVKRARNRLVHFGKKPENVDFKEMEFFIRTTDCLAAKTLNLTPSNLFNTEEKRKEFLYPIR